MNEAGKKRIGITGVRGFIGGRVARLAAERGWTVVGFSRSATALPGMESRRFDLAAVPDLSGLDAVVHLAGENIFGLWTAAKKRRIRESRIEGTRRVVEGLQRTGRPDAVLVSGSAVGFYGDTADRQTDESAPAGTGFLADVVRAWESEALQAETAGFRVALIRTGMVLGRGGGAARLLKPVFRSGLGGRLGNGNQWMACVHLDDVAGMILFAAENPGMRGPFNAVLPEPVTNRTFTRAAARVARRPAILPAPAPVLRLVLGELSSVMLASQRVIPRRMREAGYTHRFPFLPEALRDAFR